MKEQDDIAQTRGYLDEARLLLEDAFAGTTVQKKRWTVPIISAAAGLAAAAAIAFMVLVPRSLQVSVSPDGRSLSVGSWVSSPIDEGLTLSFSDGSEVDLADNSEVRLQELKDEGAHLLIERGEVDFSVVHRSTTSWRVDAGPYQIAVTGTRFAVHWTPERKAFSVDVTEGTIEVEGPMLADGKALSVGDRLTVSLLDNIAEIYKKDTYERIVAGENADTDGNPVRDSTKIASAKPDSPADDTLADSVGVHRRDARLSHDAFESWKNLARRGAWEAAVDAAERDGIKGILAGASPADLMLLGDAARLAKSYHRAVQVYKTVRGRFPGTPEAQRAAFTTGRIEFEANGKYAAAVRWFRACIADNAAGALTREASGRLIEALEHSGDQTGAREAAKRYLASYRNGPHAGLAKQILSKSPKTL